MTPTIPLTARTAITTGFDQEYVIKDDHPVKQPSELNPGECLVKLDYTGVCHSDIHVGRGEWAWKAPLPLIGGHEGVGHVVAIGEHSEAGSVKVGDRVGVKWIGRICMSCEMCRKGHESCCPISRTHSHGYRIPGTFSQYVVSYVNYVTHIPDELDSAAAAPLLCAGLTIYRALKEANLGVGDWVSISGAGGGLGHLGVQYAVAMGLRVLAIDTGEAKKELCLKLGAEKWVDFQKSEDLTADVQAATGGSGPQAAVIAAGVPKPFNQALMYLRETGTLVCVGMPGGGAMINAPVNLLIAKKLNIVGSSLGNRQDVIEALQLAAQGKVKCQYEVKEFSELQSVLKDLDEGKITGRVVLRL
ncbi:chaperonin 10-like protein [Collybia nuda]|uniref:alcohol dehydrogenase n=1 Tax=Collybia nuda TaxID=64659 RepID=A0A9P5YGF1_9AGAR|nr:chaperonin 10-like protein [Collybia nuda]